MARGEDDHVALGKALEALEHAVAMDPTGDALSELGRARLAAEDPALAERTLRQATEALPAPPAAFLDLAQVSEQNRRLPEARRALLDYAALAGHDETRRSGVAERIGDLSVRLGEPGMAADWYAAALEGARPAPDLLLRLARLQVQAGATADARRTLTQLLDKDPDHAQARALLARLELPEPPQP